jgi:hypothetical protein
MPSGHDTANAAAAKELYSGAHRHAAQTTGIAAPGTRIAR